MTGKLPHYVSDEPFDPDQTQAAGTVQSERYMRASQSQLVWWRFRRHRVAFFSLIFLCFSYGSIVIAEFLAPYPLAARHTDSIFMPPQPVHMFHEGRFVGPFTYRMVGTLDMETLERNYVPDRSQPMPLRFFCRGEPYLFWGLVRAEIRLVCPPDGGTMFLLGTDRLGRDLASRIIYGARISLTIGLVGVALSFVLGLFFGGMAGYFGGRVDYWVQRTTEVLRSIPELPLWLALSAALPVTWSPLLVYFGITLILALLDWPSLARAVRSKLLSLREEDFTAAAVTIGARPRRIIARHLIPNFMSHLIASASLSIPTMILAETALSFLGLGLRPPITSWGVLLTEAQNIEAVALYPWLLFPMVPVIFTVLAFSFLGDGLRDALDPHTST
ncbi:ABC transporter permease [Aliihoeflea sp. PC F10.4]